MSISFQRLLTLPLLKNLPQEQLEHLASQMKVQQFSRRETVLRRDQSHFALGFLLEGRLQGVDFTVDGRSVGLYFVAPGDYFGELPVVDGHPPSEYLIALSKSTVAFLNAQEARRLIFETPTLAQVVMTRLATRLRELSAQRTLLALPNPFQRLCLQLLQLSKPTRDGTLVLDPVPTHQELAIMINTSRETVTRAFQHLLLKKIVHRQGTVLRLLDNQFLSDVGEGRLDPP